MCDKLSTRQKAVATAVIWVVYVALLIFGKQMFGPATGSWSWGLLIVALSFVVARPVRAAKPQDWCGSGLFRRLKISSVGFRPVPEQAGFSACLNFQIIHLLSGSGT
jgi:hypothetical protein